MVGGKGLSWADEVDQEEEAILQSQINNKGLLKRPNPFGSARPREVVLEEKGIDWRSLNTKIYRIDTPPWKENRLDQSRETFSMAKTERPTVQLRQGVLEGQHHQPLHVNYLFCNQGALPIPAYNPCLPLNGCVMRTTERIQYRQINARSYSKEMDLSWQNSRSTVHQRQIHAQKIDKISEHKFGGADVEDPRSYPRNRNRKVVSNILDIPSASLFVGNNNKRETESASKLHLERQRRNKR